MTWATLSHAEMAQRLRELLAADPPKPPRILYAAPDGRHHLNGSSSGDSAHREPDLSSPDCNGEIPGQRRHDDEPVQFRPAANQLPRPAVGGDTGCAAVAAAGNTAAGGGAR